MAPRPSTMIIVAAIARPTPDPDDLGLGGLVMTGFSGFLSCPCLAGWSGAGDGWAAIGSAGGILSGSDEAESGVSTDGEGTGAGRGGITSMTGVGLGWGRFCCSWTGSIIISIVSW